MRGFSSESFEKFNVLNFILPFIGRIMSAARNVLFVDAFAGPGQFSHPELGGHPGSPAILWNTLRFMPNAQRTLALIDNHGPTFSKLMHTALGWAKQAGLTILPIHGSCHTLLKSVVEGVAAAQTLIFSDPCGCSIPKELPELVTNPNVTVILRYSRTAAARTRKELDVELSKLHMPYWCVGGESDGRHQYQMLLGTHSEQIADACMPALRPVTDADNIGVVHVGTPAVELERSHDNNAKASRKYKLSDHKIAQIKQLRAQGTAHNEIAAMVGCSRWTAWHYGKDVLAAAQISDGIERRTSRTFPMTDAESEQIKALRKSGMSISDVAKKLGCSTRTVWWHSRSAKTNKGGKRSPTSGRPRVDLSPTQLTKAKAMRKDGMSFTRISKKLGFAVPTLTRKMHEAGVA